MNDDLVKRLRYPSHWPQWPEDRTGVWLAALHACKNVVQSKVDQTLAELKGK